MRCSVHSLLVRNCHFFKLLNTPLTSIYEDKQLVLPAENFKHICNYIIENVFSLQNESLREWVRHQIEFNHTILAFEQFHAYCLSDTQQQN